MSSRPRRAETFSAISLTMPPRGARIWTGTYKEHTTCLPRPAWRPQIQHDQIRQYAGPGQTAPQVGGGDLEAVALEGAAERSYRAEVNAQLAADAIGIPRLPARAEAAIGAIVAAKDEAGRLAAWKLMQTDAGLGAELKAFRATVEQRFGASRCVPCYAPRAARGLCSFNFRCRRNRKAAGSLRRPSLTVPSTVAPEVIHRKDGANYTNAL